MKTLVLLLSTFLSIQVIADDRTIDLSNFHKISDEIVKNISKALVIANDGDSQYGTCDINLDWPIINEKVEVYVADFSTDPAIIFLGDAQWAEITTNDESTEIVAIQYGDYIWKEYNEGTLINPHFVKRRTITSSKDANDCK